MVYATKLPLGKADRLRLDEMIDIAKGCIQDGKVEGDYEHRKKWEVALLAFEYLKQDIEQDRINYKDLTSNPVDRGDNTGKSKW